MAEIGSRLPDNVPGKFYVDENCIDCDLCRQTAPDSFRRNDEAGYTYVFKQPANQSEEEACADAMAECPVEAIGDDGQ